LYVDSRLEGYHGGVFFTISSTGGAASTRLNQCRKKNKSGQVYLDEIKGLSDEMVAAGSRWIIWM
jgi:hypothetical protein